MIFITNNPKETIKLGRELGRFLKKGNVVALSGELGTGKTHFIKGIAEALNIIDEITSPTFTIVNEYDGNIRLNHFDFYRLKDENELFNIGFDEYIFSDSISAIEWADLIPSSLPEDYIEVKINILKLHKREISVKGVGNMDMCFLKGINL